MKNNMSREEQARVQLGNTEISKKAAIFLSIFFLIIIISVPLLDGIHDLINYFTGKRKDILPTSFNIYPAVGKTINPDFSHNYVVSLYSVIFTYSTNK